MPDITKCDGKKCPLKENCYRYKAIPSPIQQSWFMHPPYSWKENKCKSFWPYYKIVE